MWYDYKEQDGTSERRERILLGRIKEAIRALVGSVSFTRQRGAATATAAAYAIVVVITVRKVSFTSTDSTINIALHKNLTA